MYYTVIKHSCHLRTLGKCRKHSPAARAFYISLVFSNACRVLSQCKTRLRLLYLLNKQQLTSNITSFFGIWAYSLLVGSDFTTLFSHVQHKLRFYFCSKQAKGDPKKNIPWEISSLTLGIPCKIRSYTHKVLNLLKPWFWPCTPSANEMFCPEGYILKNSLSWDSSQSPCSFFTHFYCLTNSWNQLSSW